MLDPAPVAAPTNSLPPSVRVMRSWHWWALAAVPVVIVAVAAWQRRWLDDDAFINLRIVDQIKAGHGPVFNAGERVEAGTSPLWLLTLLVGDLVLPVRLEWVAALLGITGVLSGMALAMLGSRRLLHATGSTDALIPFGMLVFAAVPVVWDFTTSGLEVGLSVAWLGACTAALAYGLLAEPRAGWRPLVPVAVLLGLGPLVRPDFVTFSAVFVIVWCLRFESWRRRTLALLAAIALPVAYELFRMGYYGLLVPNTALAKEGTSSYWSQGWHYLADFVGPYFLWIPVVLVVAFGIVPLVRAGARRDRWIAVAALVPVGAALVETLYVVRVGGDFMHGRMLIPPFFAFLAPVALAPARRSVLLGAGAVVVWAIVSSGWLRVDYAGPSAIGPHGIADERTLLLTLADSDHPVAVGHYPLLVNSVRAFRAQVEQDGGGYFLPDVDALDVGRLPLRSGADFRAATPALILGAFSYAAGPDIGVADRLGLANPIDSHFRLDERGRPGHEKLSPPAWILAAYTRAGVPEHANVRAARAALRCGTLRDVWQATTDHLDAGRFFTNLVNAPRLTFARVSKDPQTAVRELCARS